MFIISHILTAAHCIVLNVTEYQDKALVKYGSVRTDEGMTDVKLGKPPHYHPSYENYGLGHDIAVYFLEDDIEIDADAFPVCLYHNNVDLEIESRATVAGFGKMPSICQMYNDMNGNFNLILT